MHVQVYKKNQQESLRLLRGHQMAIITLNRKKKLNALSVDFWERLYEMIQNIKEDQRTKVLIIRGQGNAFSAGSDIVEFSQLSLKEVDQAFEMLEKAITAVEQLPIPTVCSINGPAMGGGLQLALACDLRVGSEHAKMGIPVGRLGITVSHRFAKRLYDILGPSKTKDLIYTGRFYVGEEALQVGLLDYMFSSKEITRQTVRLASTILKQSPASLRAIKEAVAALSPHQEISWNDRGFPYHVHPLDFPEGIRSFLEKREPKFYS